MAADHDTLHVVVLDDVVRFALHVWRYLGRSLGFGIGKVPPNEREHFYEGRQPTPCWTADRSAAVWWVRAGKGWRPELRRVLRKVKREGGDLIFLVDVKVFETRAGDYSAQDVVRWLETDESIDRDSILVVSSYADSVPGHRVWPKSPETLQSVRNRMPKLEPQPGNVIGDPGILDVLVTGAGFELRSPPRRLGFGQPRTADLLWHMDSPFGRARGARMRLEKTREGFPVPIHDEFEPPGRPKELGSHEPGHRPATAAPRSASPKRPENAGADPSLHHRMAELARVGLLDEWWDLLLETELGAHLGSAGDRGARRAAKREARQLEVEMRSAFRDAVLRHDWGHLSQCLNAVRLPWSAWLTTNYSRFADRAIALAEDARAREPDRFEGAPRWRVVATAQEAQLLLRELQDRAEEAGAKDGSKDSPKPLFKLHGDISHLQTMALAGHDKDLYGLLSVPVDSVYQVYNVAEKYLLHLSRAFDGREMRFHVVGHGLQDEALVQVLASVVQARKGQGVTLVLVGPDGMAVPRALEDACVIEKQETAEPYMASLGPASR